MAFLGLRGTSDFSTSSYIGSWMEYILWQLPRSNKRDCPLTALMSRLPRQEFNTANVNWAEEGNAVSRLTVSADNGATITVVETNGGFTTRAGIQMIAEETGEQIICTGDGNAQTVQTGQRGFGTASSTLTAGMHLTILSSSHPEGTPAPTGLSNNPTWNLQYLQTMKETFEIAEEAKDSYVREGDPLTNEQFRALLRWGSGFERALFYSAGNLSIQTINGKPQRTMYGINSILATNIFNVNGLLTATQLNSIYDQAWHYSNDSSDEKVWFCGSTQFAAVYGVESSRNNVQVNFKPGDDTFGLDFTKIITPFGGKFYIFSHPLFNENAWLRQQGFILDMANLRYAYQQKHDLDLFEDILTDNHPMVRKDEWQAIAGIQVAHEMTHAVIRGVTGYGT